MATELTKVRFSRLCDAIKKVNNVEGIVNAEFVAVENKRAVIYVKSQSVSEFYDTLVNVGIYPLIIDTGDIYTLSVKLEGGNRPMFEAVEL